MRGRRECMRWVAVGGGGHALGMGRGQGCEWGHVSSYCYCMYIFPRTIVYYILHVCPHILYSMVHRLYAIYVSSYYWRRQCMRCAAFASDVSYPHTTHIGVWGHIHSSMRTHRSIRWVILVWGHIVIRGQSTLHVSSYYTTYVSSYYSIQVVLCAHQLHRAVWGHICRVWGHTCSVVWGHICSNIV